jgi:hypothetical protein
MNNNNINKLDKSKENKLHITNQTLSNTYSHDFTPMIITTSILAPLNRIKIILQTNRLISIDHSQKVNRASLLAASK